MEIIKMGVCGTMESSDIHITVRPNPEKGIDIRLKSPVEKQYGKVIRKVIKDTLTDLGIEEAIIEANDKGALDYAIIARVQCAAARASGLEDNLYWEVQ